LTADDMDGIVDIVAMMTFTVYGVHSQCMPISRTLISFLWWHLLASG